MIYENGSLKRILIDGGYIEGGAYYFYLTDHLGNNCVVANANGGIVQTNHYYPFGMSFAEGVTTSKQPYKYNGKELDTEKGLNLYDYSTRLMDPVLGRFSTIDPKADKNYSISPYAYCLNNPMKFVDPDGRLIVFASGVSDQFKKNYMTAKQTLITHGLGGFLKILEGSKITYTITESRSLESTFNSKNNTLTWSSTAMLLTTNGTSLSPTTLLNHELDHAAQKDQNPEQQKRDGNTKSTKFGNKEEERVITGSEQQTAKALGEIDDDEVTRTDHGGTLYQTNSPTSTEIINEITITALKKEEKK